MKPCSLQPHIMGSRSLSKSLSLSLSFFPLEAKQWFMLQHVLPLKLDNQISQVHIYRTASLTIRLYCHIA